MNYLAHMHLAFPYRELMVGNFLADFFPKKVLENLTEKYQIGVAFHRHIDSFTDAYFNKKEALALLYPTHGKYAGVVLDVFYDRFLVQYWNQFSDLPMDVFEYAIYGVLEEEKVHLSEPFLQKVETVIDRQWLVKSVQDDEGLKDTFRRIEVRAKYPGHFHSAIDTLNEHEEALTQFFLPFYTDLIEVCEEFVFENRTRMACR